MTLDRRVTRRGTHRTAPAMAPDFSVESVMTREHIRGGFYGRASVDITGARTSVDRQLATGHEQAARHRITIDPKHVWSDNDQGASDQSKRKRGEDSDWKRCMAAVRAGELDVLIMTESSRASRDPAEWSKLMKACQKTQTLLLIGGQIYNPINPDHATLLGINSVVASAESHRTLMRTLSGKEEGARRGRPNGRPEWGYLRQYDDRGALVAVVPDPDITPIATEIFRRYTQWEPIDHICADLTRRRIPTPSHRPGRDIKQWHAALLLSVIDSPRWIGKRWRFDKLVPAMWDRVVPDEVWYQAQARRDSARKIQPRSTAALLLTGVATCGPCGAPLRGSARLQRYACKGWGTPGDTRGMGHVACQVSLGDTIVEHTAWAVLSDTRLAGRYEEAAGEADAETEEAAAELAELREEIDALPGKVERDEMDAMIADAQMRKLKRRVEELEPAATPKVGSALRASVADPDPARVKAAWEALTVHQQRALVVDLFEEIALLPIGTGRRRSVDRPTESFRIVPRK